MFKFLFQIVFLFIHDITFFAQENEERKEDISKTEESISQNIENKEDLEEKNGDEEEQNDINKKEDFDFGDNIDMNLFNRNQARNFFVVSPLGIGLNGLLYSKGSWWHNGFDSFSLFNNFCANIKEYKHKMLLSNRIFSFDIVQYNIIIGKGFTFFVGLNLTWKHFLFFQENEKCLKYLSVFPNNQELDALGKRIDLNEKNEKRKEDLEKESNEYIKKTEQDMNKTVYSMSLSNVGLLTGFGWYSNLLDLKKSWFLKILIYARYQSVKNFSVLNGGISEDIKSKYLRINPFDLTCGLEFGRGKFSILFFMSILPLLNEKKKYDNGKEEGERIKCDDNNNLFNCGCILKINIF